MKRTAERRLSWVAFCLVLALAPASVWPQAYYASKDRNLVIVSDVQVKRSLEVTDTAVDYAYGALAPSGQYVIGSGLIERKSSYQPIEGTTLYLVSQDGKTRKKIAEDVLDAFPASRLNRLAFITRDFRLHIFQDGKVTTASFPNTTNYVSWLPDADRLVLTGRDADWSYDAMSSPRDTEEFLRMNTSNLFLYDISSDTLTALTDNDQANYNPVAAPD
ncbi:MAG TPA: hypothetical protein PKH07_18275, partial [bacterium]|nr:hypothetical protein [bacterium]